MCIWNGGYNHPFLIEYCSGALGPPLRRVFHMLRRLPGSEKPSSRLSASKREAKRDHFPVRARREVRMNVSE